MYMHNRTYPTALDYYDLTEELHCVYASAKTIVVVGSLCRVSKAASGGCSTTLYTCKKYENYSY